MAEEPFDRFAIPSSRLSDAENRRHRRYNDELRNQDLSHANDEARDKAVQWRRGDSRARAAEVPDRRE